MYNVRLALASERGGVSRCRWVGWLHTLTEEYVCVSVCNVCFKTVKRRTT